MGRRFQVEAALRSLAPGIPSFEADAVVDRAMHSAGLRHAVPEEAAWLALTAFVRHTMTEYDALLEEGYDHDSARFFVVEPMNAVLRDWRARRKVSADAEDG